MRPRAIEVGLSILAVAESPERGKTASSFNPAWLLHISNPGLDQNSCKQARPPIAILPSPVGENAGISPGQPLETPPHSASTPGFRRAAGGHRHLCSYISGHTESPTAAPPIGLELV